MVLLKGQITDELTYKAAGSVTSSTDHVYSHARNYFSADNHHEMIRRETGSASLQFTQTFDKSTYLVAKFSYFQELTKQGDNKLWDDFSEYGNSAKN